MNGFPEPEEFLIRQTHSWAIVQNAKGNKDGRIRRYRCCNERLGTGSLRDKRRVLVSVIISLLLYSIRRRIVR